MKNTDLRWFFLEDTSETLKNAGYIDFRFHLNESLKKHLRFYFLLKIVGIFLRALYYLFKILFISKQDSDVIVVQQSLTRYPLLIKALKMHFNVSFIGIDLFSITDAIKYRASYLSMDKASKNLNKGLLKNEDILLEKSLEEMKTILKSQKVNYVLLNNDHLPESRLIVQAAKEIGIKSIEIQHGVYPSTEPLITGKHVDYLLVWGKFFKNLYLKQKIRDKESIKVLGYPYQLNKNISKKLMNKKLKPKVVYLGQNFELHNNDLLAIKIDTVNSLNSICDNLNLKFTYRPHPYDDIKLLKKKLPNIKFSRTNEKLETSFRKNDIFISFNSTALVEAVLNGKVGLQLKNYPLPTDDFQKIGVCQSFQNIGELRSHLKKLSKNNNALCNNSLNGNYITIPSPDPGKKLIILLKELE